jgi:hypothetical protein
MEGYRTYEEVHVLLSKSKTSEALKLLRRAIPMGDKENLKLIVNLEFRYSNLIKNKNLRLESSETLNIEENRIFDSAFDLNEKLHNNEAEKPSSLEVAPVRDNSCITCQCGFLKTMPPDTLYSITSTTKEGMSMKDRDTAQNRRTAFMPHETIENTAYKNLLRLCPNISTLKEDEYYILKADHKPDVTIGCRHPENGKYSGIYEVFSKHGSVAVFTTMEVSLKSKTALALIFETAFEGHRKYIDAGNTKPTKLNGLFNSLNEQGYKIDCLVVAPSPIANTNTPNP